MVNITSALRRVKDDLPQLLDACFIEQLCRQAGHQWRDRELDPATTVGLFIQQVMHGNVSCQQLIRISHGRFSASAYCQARGRLPLGVLEALNTHVADRAAAATDHDLFHWRGHRTLTTDGSNCSMPDTPELQACFGQPGGQAPGCGFPVAHTLHLFDAHTGVLGQTVISPMRTHDMAHVSQLHQRMQSGDLLMGDTAFGSYAHLALLLQNQMHGLFPMHQRRIVDFTIERPHAKPASGKNQNKTGLPRSKWHQALGNDDQIVAWFKPKECPAWMMREAYEALPDSILVREVRRKVRMATGKRITVTLATTLLDPDQYPADELVKLLGCRWEVEVNLRHLKTTMGMEVLRCKTVQGVRKELAVYALVYNLVRLVMLEAAFRQRVDVRRISFADAWYWLRHARHGDVLPKLLVNPHRPQRIEPRAIKRRPKNYPLLNKPRAVLRQMLLQQEDTA